MPEHALLDEPVSAPRAVRLATVWHDRRENFHSSLLTLLRGPAPPQGWPVGEFFQDTWLRGRPPWRSLSASALWHFFALLIPVWLWTAPASFEPAPRQYSITWSGPIRDLLPYSPARTRSKPRMPGQRAQHNPRSGADAFHPRQTIISAPPKITHPRQTLLQPDAPLEPPKILPPLPNVALWTPAPSRPRLRVNTSARIRARALARHAAEAAPELKDRPTIAAINLVNSAPALVPPKLEVRRTAQPQFRDSSLLPAAAPAPDAASPPAAEIGAQRLLALSASPAPPPPKLEVPPGNLAARFAISPEGKQPGIPGGAANGSGAEGAGTANGLAAGGGTGTAGGGNGTAAIPGISITGGKPGSSTTVAGAGSGIAASPGRKLQLLPVTPSMSSPAMDSSRTPQESLLNRSMAGLPPESILDSGRIYTLHVNMPNLASVTGSWVLKFSELEDAARKSAQLTAAPDLAGPVPLRKVDPKFPPSLASARIQGEVVLYAIIRRDGSVDSIQLLKGLNPQLDQNAMDALARWKFRAAERKGKPVELETIVRIPFRTTPSSF
jgi:protein TonB